MNNSTIDTQIKNFSINSDFTDETFKMIIDHINTLDNKSMYECWKRIGAANVNNAIRLYLLLHQFHRKPYKCNQFRFARKVYQYRYVS